MSRASMVLLCVAGGVLAVLALNAPRAVAPARVGRLPAMEFLPPKGYVCTRARSAIQVDGRLDDAAWADAPWSDGFQDIEGDRRPAPRHSTRMKMLWDADYLYIAAEIEEPHVWATLTERDSIIFHDHDFEVFLDPDGDGHNYAELEINALNTVWDLFLPRPYRAGGPALHDWDIPGLRTGVAVQGTLNDPADRDRGWTVEIAWPWKNLKEFAGVPVPPREGDQWRVNFSRVEWDLRIQNGKYEKVPMRPEANWVWSPQGAVDMHRPEKWGVVQFTAGPADPARYEPDPTLPAREALHRVWYAQEAFRKRHGRPARSLDELRLSLYHPGFSNLWIDATLSDTETRVTVPGSQARDGKPLTLRMSGEGRITRN